MGDSVFADRLRALLGVDHVCVNSEDLLRYSRCTIPWQKSCAAVVFPSNAEEIAGVLRIATEHRRPVWPFSTGRNWGYGTTLALEDGAIVMILERMNRVLEINEDLAYAVIEPGVTYEQLNAHLKKHGYRLWADCIDGTPYGSVIGNALERGVGETPYGDHFGNLCGMEVVLPTGERVTVGATSPELKTWHTHKWGVGPYLEGLFSQSNLGVVTKAGIWLMPEPEAYESYVFELRDERDLAAVLDAFRRLALQGVVTSKLHMINDFVSLTVLTQRADEGLPMNGALTRSDVATLRHKYGIATWSCGGGLYGTRGQVRVQRGLLRKALGPFGRLIFMTDRRIAHLERLIALASSRHWLQRALRVVLGTSLSVLKLAPHAHRVLKGIPTEYFVRHAYFRKRTVRPDADVHPARDDCGLIWFAPILPLTGAEVVPYLEACRRSFEAHGFDFYVAMLMTNPRSVVCLMAILYDRADDADAARADRLYRQLVQDMVTTRLQQYRVGLGGWSGLLDGSRPLHELCGRIKAALDPAHILAPGRYGTGTVSNGQDDAR